MGLCNSPKIFQAKVSELFVDIDTVHVYIGYLFHVTKGSWTEHLTVLEEIFTCLQKSWLKVNASKSCFGAHKFDYLGYHVTHYGVMPTPKKSRQFKPSQFQKLTKNWVSLLV